MISVGFYGLPVLDQLHRWQLSRLAGATIIVVASLMVGQLFDLVPLELSEWAISVQIDPPEYGENPFYGLLLAAVFVFVRDASSDAASLVSETDLAEIAAAWRFSWRFPIFCFLFLTAGVEGLFFLMYHLGLGGADLVSVLSVPLLGGSELIFFHFVFLPLGALIASICLCAIWQINRILISIARTMKVSLYRLHEYSVIANSVVRLFCFVVVLLSFFPIYYLVGGTGERVALLINIMIFTLAIPSVAMLLAPVWVLHSRIRDTREVRLAEIVDQLDDRNPELTLLTELTFLESRSDWPVAGHVKQVLLLGLIPPISWILAAVVENTLY